MAAVKPMLGDIELQLVQKIEVDGDQVLVQHSVPVLEGDFLQRLDRRAMQITITGVLSGQQAGKWLKSLRDKFRAAEPVPFVADIASATRVDEVLIEEMGVRELAGRPERFEYAFTLREYIPPPAVARETPPEIPTPESPAEQIDQRSGTLMVKVSVEGEPEYDLSHITITVEGNQGDGTALSRTLVNRIENIWSEEDFPVGEYVAKAMANPRAMSGIAQATVQAGQTTQASINLQPTSNIAKTFIVHFRFNRAFVEPCMRSVLQQVTEYAKSPNHQNERLLIVGHTDKVDIPEYNQSLSERRARAVFAFLTVGGSEAAREDALAEWNSLREERPKSEPRNRPSIKDSWGTREYQHMLQDLGYYPGMVDGKHGPQTDDAVSAFRCKKGLPSGTDVDDDVWQALIEDYLTKDALDLPIRKFFPNCQNEILKWLGCGEEDPLDRTEKAYRPSRRVELMFVRTDRLPCEIARPATFELPEPESVNKSWCIGPNATGPRCCFVSRHLTPEGKQNPCTSSPEGPWCRQPAESGMITVNVSIERERPDGTFEPVPNQEFVLISPKGQFKAGEQPKGEPVPARTTGGSGSDKGTFQFPNMPVGIYSLEVITPPSASVLVRLKEKTDKDIKGNAVCKGLRSDQDQLDVVIVNAPVLREIRLPVVAHLMTALNLSSRDIRVCPDPSNPAKRIAQATTRKKDEIISLFDDANCIWRQARIRFELKDIVKVTYAHPTKDLNTKGKCEVDEDEFKFILSRCAYPDAVNVFFFKDFAGCIEAGMGISAEDAAVDGLPSGCAIADQQDTISGGLHIVLPLTPEQSKQMLAHELGHYLNLKDIGNTAANVDRLMLEKTLIGNNRKLVKDEVESARASKNAANNCIPLKIRVTGACQVGGTLSNEYIIVQKAGILVDVDAIISDRLLAPDKGILTMTDGSIVVEGRHFNVSAASTGRTEVTATYVPYGDGQAVSKRVVIRVVTFTLSVKGAVQSGTDYFAAYNPTKFATVVANIDPAPFGIPTTLVRWDGGNTTPDPLCRIVAKERTTKVTAILCGTSVSVVIQVIDETLILHPALGFPGLAKTGSEIIALFLAKNDIWTKLGEVPWHFEPWQDPKQTISVEVLEGPKKIESSRIQKTEEGWVLLDHHLKLNRNVMALYESPGFTQIMWIKLKAPDEQGMYRLVNHFAEGEVLRSAIRKIHELDAYKKDFPAHMPLIPDLGTTSVTTIEGKNSNIPVELYHPVYLANKSYLDIAHVTDTHISLTWELYNRRSRPSHQFNNYNRRFEDIMREARGNADIILLTGDMIDYNRGHSHPWDNSNDFESDYQFNRNWLLMYELLLNCSHQNNAKPIFSLLGNHDWNLNACAPMPTWLGIIPLFRASHEFNLLNAEMEAIDPGDAHAADLFGTNSARHATPASILWYSLVINPFLDFAFHYEDMAFLCLDWGRGAAYTPPASEAAYQIDPGILPYPERCLSDSQLSLITGWNNAIRAKNIKVLALHATIYQPFAEIGFEDLSKGRIHDELIEGDPLPEYHPTRIHYNRYTHGELIYGAIVNDRHRRDLINLLRDELTSLVLSGHSHRNTIFQIRRQGDNEDERIFMYRASDLASLDLRKTIFITTTSAGPFGFENEKGVAEHLDGLRERRKVQSGFRIIRFGNTGEITALDTLAISPPLLRPDVQQEFHEN